MSSTLTKDSVLGLMDTIRKLYLADDIPWVIGYSGGKDSTATLELVWMALKELPSEQRKKQVHIINTDTLVESPVVAKWAHNSLKMMDKQAALDNLPFITHILYPDFKNTFWVNLIGRGYPFPRKKYRWCTDRLKIEPVNNFIKEKIAEHGEVVLVVGTRKAESSRRRHTMEYYEKKRVRELLSPNPTLANELVFSPLSEWSDDDVWVFLMQYKNPWGYSNNDLLTLYRGATADNECPLMYEKNLPTCGNSRFGCWVCTMVAQDKSMAAMITNDQEKAWMTPMLEFRDYFGTDDDTDRNRREFKRKNGSLQGSYKRLFHGPYNKEYREIFLRKLLQTEKKVNELCPEEFKGIKLITIEELREIRRIWHNDFHEFDDMVPVIYKEETGHDFDDPYWSGNETYTFDEWQILKKVCEEFPEETQLFEMAYSILDTELKTNGINQRKGVVEAMIKEIKKNFYKDEDDALSYYREKVVRADRFDAVDKKDAKFLIDYVKEDPGEDVDI
ncbi:DNA phosphorothioation system sulfurtransferase DndC [Erysipelotrichaceae bacterium Oil+RF-744-GAM-WT-6]|uniref:DNA phosphorothioation system sulfurtransferase DndC n=1 Tax=Stecheria intestinalis TaxID=2606630 RepID=A0A7X2NS54_9FIRM|nr:DNA phosphorothioation system sulfurtransferase DndC [Stecheria intestinalis]MSS58440.1 DNA phosphorothioation system sulfurtransferase DndC [Stecheria intestinalis]